MTYTHVPNSYQKPNVFADEIMRLLSPTQNMVLDAACRKIMGWETRRITRRDRISLSQFQTLTGLSIMTIRSSLAHLATANLLTPIGERAGRTGQEYELNLGQRGDYRWEFLRDHAPARWNPEQARTAQQTPDVAVPSVLTDSTLAEDYPANQPPPSVLIDSALVCYPLATPNSLNSERELEIDSIWQQALRVLRARLLPLTYEDWIATARLDALPGGVRLVFRRAEAPNTRAWLETHLAPLLREALAPDPVEFGFTHPFTGE